jgi:PilZ domain
VTGEELDMQATFAAGTTLNVVFREPSTHHKVRATVAGATDAALLLDLGDAGARPVRGADVSLVVGSRIFETVVNHVDERWTTVRRPDLLVVDDQRRTMRSPTKLLVRWRLAQEPGAGMEAAYVVDLSARGARVLAEDRPGRVVGAAVNVDVGRHHLTGTIRRVEAHEHGQLSYYGIEFDDLTKELQTYIFRTLGKVRIGEHDWA